MITDYVTIRDPDGTIRIVLTNVKEHEHFLRK
jgi:hypothetical protein